MKTTTFLTLLAALLIVPAGQAAVSFSGTAMLSGNSNVVASTSVGVLINRNSGSSWLDITNIAAGSIFTNTATFTLGGGSFTVFGRNTTSGLGSVPGTATGFSYTTGMDQNDEFAILLFPNIGQVTNGVSGGTTLSLWRSNNWVLPVDAGGTFTFNNTGGTFNQIANSSSSLTTFNVVPEPSTYALLALSGVAFGGYMIRRRRRA